MISAEEGRIRRSFTVEHRSEALRLFLHVKPDSGSVDYGWVWCKFGGGQGELKAKPQGVSPISTHDGLVSSAGLLIQYKSSLKSRDTRSWVSSLSLSLWDDMCRSDGSAKCKI